MASEGSILSIGTFGGLCFPFDDFEVIAVEGNGDVGTTFNSLCNNFFAI